MGLVRVTSVGYLAMVLAAGCGSVKTSPSVEVAGMENAIRARVERVVDVNTIMVSANGMEEAVRLAGVDKTGYEVPEEKCRKAQACLVEGDEASREAMCHVEGIEGPGQDLRHMTGQVQAYRSEKAMAFTKQLLQDEKVILIPLDPARDAEKNLVALVYRESDRLFANYAIVRMGYGLVKQQEGFDLLPSFQAAQAAAQMEKLGLWGAPLPEDENGVVTPAQLPVSDDYIVFVSRRDHLYHVESCSKLDETRYPIQLKDAKSGKYKPCSQCFSKPK